MYAQELLVEQGGEGQAVEGLHAGVIDTLRVLDLTCSTHTHTHGQPFSPAVPDQAGGMTMCVLLFAGQYRSSCCGTGPD